jgi:hypothetical protein
MQGPAKLLHRRRQAKFGRRAGRVDVTPRPLREKISTDEGGLSQSPPFLLIERIGSLKRFRFFDLEGGKFSVLSHPFSKTVHFFFFRRFGGPKACITLSSFST